MKLSLSLAEKLILLLSGETLPASSLKSKITEELLAEGILWQQGRVQRKIGLSNPESLKLYLQSKLGIADLENYIKIIKSEEVTRGKLIEVASDSKFKPVRSFTGFLINHYDPVKVRFKGVERVWKPLEGTFRFIYDFRDFTPDSDLTIVGIENPENFRHIQKQRYLFQNINPLFVSRYPQNQSKDLIEWLQMIPNHYLHFGDFDLAGIRIYQNEFQKYLEKKAGFLVPENIEELLSSYGNSKIYDTQYQSPSDIETHEPRLKKLLNLIHHYGKGLEQEILIDKSIS